MINEIEIAIEVTPNVRPGNTDPSMGSSLKEEIIKECVERVMEIINQKTER